MCSVGSALVIKAISHIKDNSAPRNRLQQFALICSLPVSSQPFTQVEVIRGGFLTSEANIHPFSPMLW